ncbi:hypothetical protein BH11PLA2_BH11PLA2_25190 [soil metagenome]
MSSLFDSEPLYNGTPEGEARRDAALNRLRVHRGELIRQFQAAAVRFALERGEVCADDVRPLVVIPPGMSPKLVGTVFRDLSEAGILRHNGYRKSRRAMAHARPLTVWKLADAGRAAAWLASHRTI